MTKYQWDIQKIRKLRDDINKNEKTINNADLYEAAKEVYQMLLETYNINKICSIEEDPIYEETEYNFFKYINMEALDIISELNIKNLKTKKNLHLNQRIYLNNDQLIELVREAIRLIPDKSLNLSFDKYFDPKNHLVNIQHIKYPLDTYGTTINDFVNNINYINLYRTNSLYDIFSTFHEFFHAHIRSYEKYNYSTSKKVIYGETEGYFANFLIYHLINNLNIDKNLLLFKIQYDFNCILDNLKLLSIYNKSLKESCESDIFGDILGSIEHSISYLCGLDLFYIYQNDPEKALHALYNIPNLKGENIKQELLKNEITFFEDNCKNLKKLYKAI